MSNRFTFDGLSELRDALRSLPADLTAEAGNIIESAMNGAEATVRATYAEHTRTGDLMNHLSSSLTVSGFSVVGVVKNTSRLAWIFENGTQARHYITVNGKRKELGRMPPAHIFIPTMVAKRRQMYERLKDLLVRHGLAVSGEAA